jgi:hypothetical protein
MIKNDYTATKRMHEILIKIKKNCGLLKEYRN